MQNTETSSTLLNAMTLEHCTICAHGHKRKINNNHEHIVRKLQPKCSVLEVKCDSDCTYWHQAKLNILTYHNLC